MDNKKIWIIGGISLVILIAFAIFFKNDNRVYNWLEHYRMDRKDPYGLYIVHEMLNSYSDSDSNRLHNLDKDLGQLSEGKNNGAEDNYVFIGPAIKMDSSNLSNLLSFVENGNSAFIASKSIPNTLMEKIYPRTCGGYEWTDYIYRVDSIASLNLIHPNLQDSLGFDYRYLFGHQPRDYFWKYFDPDYFCDSTYSLVQLGAIDDLDINFARKDYGEGSFYLHTTPLSFTNIQLMDTLGLAYAGKVFSHLGEGKIFWDEKNKIPEQVGRKRNRDFDDIDRSLASAGPLSYILNNNSLRAAWYLFLTMGLLYLIFRTKRQQRIIPILEANKNTSLEFISTIGTLYFLQNDHKKLSQQQGNLFLGYIRNHYDLPTHLLDEQFKERLIAKSDVPEQTIKKIITLWTNIKEARFVSENTMVEFYKLLDHFYKNCK